MARTTRGDLDRIADVITQQLGGDLHTVEYAYGRPRLYRNGGSVEVSPRLPTGELAQWMRAYSAGIEARRRRSLRS